MKNFDLLYKELSQISREILPYYDIDKVKSYSVYIWTKDSSDDVCDGENVFDIHEDALIRYVDDEDVEDNEGNIFHEATFQKWDTCKIRGTQIEALDD